LHAESVDDIYSLSACIAANFADYIGYWRHNGYWLFDTPATIAALAADAGIDLAGCTLFYYEAYGDEFADGRWSPYAPDPAFATDVQVPAEKSLQGFDVVTFSARTSPECSPLSCNGLAAELPTNRHCLFASFAEAKQALEDGRFAHSEPGPYRIFAVHTLAGPDTSPPRSKQP
jgi:hypothetical protein